MMDLEKLLFNTKDTENNTVKDYEINKINSITEDILKDLLEGKGGGLEFQNDHRHIASKPLYTGNLLEHAFRPMRQTPRPPTYVNKRNYRSVSLSDYQNVKVYDNSSKARSLNPRQLLFIKHRRERRLSLNKVTKKKRGNYIHESRHKHASNRLRAPSGRFLTKAELQAVKNGSNKL